VETDPDKPSPGWLAVEREADVTLWLPGGEGRPEVPMFFRRVPPIEVWSGEGESPLFRIGERGSGFPAEEPVHHVRLERPFYLATFPVTQAQWRGVAELCGLDPDPSEFKGDFRPVEMVDWEDVTAWCQWLCKNTGAIRAVHMHGNSVVVKTLRLPCEAEWEIACRGGTTTEYWNGDGTAALDLCGWYKGNSEERTHRVGEKLANPWGLSDLHGNVWEWCEDVWDGRTYSKREEGGRVRAWTEDYAGTDKEDRGLGARRVLRGGSWGFTSPRCRTSSRIRIRPTYRYQYVGFRPVLMLSSHPRREVLGQTEP